MFPHRPVVVAVTSSNRLLCHVLAVGAAIPAPLCSENYVRSSLRTPTLHYAFIHASTSAPRGFGSLLPFHSASFIHTVSHYPSPFPTHFQRYVFIFSDESPMRQQRQSCKKLHLTGGVFSHNANSEILPRKPLMTFRPVSF